MTGTIDPVEELTALADGVLSKLMARGATEAKVVARAGQELSTRVRKNEVELVEEAGTRSLAVRAAKGKQVATASTSDVSRAGIERIVSDALELCELAQEDPFSGLPDPSELARGPFPELHLYDAACGEVRAAEAVARALEAEKAASDLDPRITNSEGSSFGRTTGAFAMVTSGGFKGGYRGSYASLTVSPVAADEGGKNRTAYYWSARRVLAKLESEVSVGREAARRTLRLLGARKVPSQSAPVIFDADAARSMIGMIAGCASGDAIYRRSSYLLERLGTPVASELVTIVDDPFVESGPGSRPFDGDGLPARKNTLVNRGTLETYLLDTYSARKLGMKSTGSAAASTGHGAGTSNLHLLPGELTPQQILSSTKQGLFVTDMMGFGFNAVTGDFSRGAVGYWVENGELAFPVSEITISLNLDEILKRIDAVGNDLELKASIASPTFRVSAMTIAGT